MGQDSTKESSVSSSKTGTSTPVLRYSRGGTFASNRSNTLKETPIKKNVNASSFRFASLREDKNGRSINLQNSNKCNSMLLMQQPSTTLIQKDFKKCQIKPSDIYQSKNKSLSIEEDNSCPIHKSQRNSNESEPEISNNKVIIAQEVHHNFSGKDFKGSKNCTLLPVNSQSNINFKEKNIPQNLNKYYLNSDFPKRKKCASLTYLPQEPCKALTCSYLSENNLNCFNIESQNRVVTTCPVLKSSKDLDLYNDDLVKNTIIESYLKGVQQSVVKTKDTQCLLNEHKDILTDNGYKDIKQTKTNILPNTNFIITDSQDESHPLL